MKKCIYFINYELNKAESYVQYDYWKDDKKPDNLMISEKYFDHAFLLRRNYEYFLFK